MQKAKKYLFTASIIQMLLSLAYLVVDGVYTGLWLAVYKNLSTNKLNIIFSVLLFVASVFIAFDGVLAIKYSRAEDDKAIKSKNGRFLMGIMYYMLALVSLVLAVISIYTSVSMLLKVTAFVGPAILIVIGILNHISYAKMNIEAKEEKIEKQTTISCKIEIDEMFDRLKALSQLKEEGLLTQEEFEFYRNEIIKKN